MALNDQLSFLEGRLGRFGLYTANPTRRRCPDKKLRCWERRCGSLLEDVGNQE